MSGAPKIGASGALAPIRGFTRYKPDRPIPAGQNVWRSHDGLVVISSLEYAHLPGSGDPPKVGPQWLVSVSRLEGTGGRDDQRCRVTNGDLERVVECFAMPAYDEDNHHPGRARHLWCPVEEQYRTACECKLDEVLVDDDGYVWSNSLDDGCRGCWFERKFGPACTVHAAEAVQS